MKQLKRVLMFLFVLCLLIGMIGCINNDTIVLDTPRVTEGSPTEESVTEKSATEQPKTSPADFVTFSRSTEPREVKVPVSEILEYETQYPDCNGTWFRNFLTGEELVVYNSYLYALENRFIHFRVYVKDSDKDFSEIRDMVSLDSPFLEQNYSHYEYISKWPINYAGESISVSMEQFTDSRWEMKLEALEKCREIVANIPPEYQTQQEKMEYLYRYVCDHVEYVMYESFADESYLYDAVCKGETVCDGYSNMLSLLFRLIGVECCEVMGISVGEEYGHTWVVARYEGKFYNFDPTFEDTADIEIHPLTYFGFSDKLVSMDWFSFALKRPRCISTSRDYHYVDLAVESITQYDDVKQIAQCVEKNLDAGVYTALLRVTDQVKDSHYDKLFDTYAYHRTVYWKIEQMYYWEMGDSIVIKLIIEQ